MAEDIRILQAYDNLAKAIVYQAMKDYRKAYKALLKKNTPSTRAVLTHLRQFFTSKWYGVLFDYDGKFMMEAIEKNALDKNGMRMCNLKHWQFTK